MISLPIKMITTYSSKHLGRNELEFIPLTMDEEMLPYLWEAGIDYNKGYSIVANLLRDPEDKKKFYVGLRYVGEIRTDREFTLSSKCSFFDRIVIAAQDKKFSCFEDLIKLSQSSSSMFSPNLKEDGENIMACDVEEDYLQNLEAINSLNFLIQEVRGDSLNKYGNLKNYEEWQQNKLQKS